AEAGQDRSSSSCGAPGGGVGESGRGHRHHCLAAISVWCKVVPHIGWSWAGGLRHAHVRGAKVGRCWPRMPHSRSLRGTLAFRSRHHATEDQSWTLCIHSSTNRSTDVSLVEAPEGT